MTLNHDNMFGAGDKPRGRKISAVGMIMLDTVFPRIPGDVGNPGTFSFPVLYEVVRGASPERVVQEADPSLLSPFIEAAQRLEERNVKAIGTSCGFLSIFHRELSDAVNIPVFSSSLLQIHSARLVMGRGRRVGVLTACSESLTERHFAGVGIQGRPPAIVGMEDAEEFTSVFLGGKRNIDVEKCRREMVAAARRLVKTWPDVGAVVLECTNMPPYADAIQEAVGLPVFDAVTMINYAYSAVAQKGF